MPHTNLAKVTRVVLVKVDPDSPVNNKFIQLSIPTHRWWCAPPARPRPPGCLRCFPTRPCPADTCPRCFRVFENRVGIWFCNPNISIQFSCRPSDLHIQSIRFQPIPSLSPHETVISTDIYSPAITLTGPFQRRCLHFCPFY